MKKILSGLSTILLLTGGAQVAGATAVDFDLQGPPGSSVLLSNVSTWGWTSLAAELAPGLDLEAFTLGDGETKEVDFFSLSASGFIGLGEADIAATLGFDLPPGISAQGSGEVGWATLFGVISGGVLNWDSATLPDTFTLANGNVIGVDFEDGYDLTLCDSSLVHAYITNYGGAAPVPEPATMLLFGAGLVGVVGNRARRQKKTTSN